MGAVLTGSRYITAQFAMLVLMGDVYIPVQFATLVLTTVLEPTVATATTLSVVLQVALLKG